MENLSRRPRKIPLTLFLAQSLASAGFITAATINSILGAKLGGSPSWAGVPTAVYLLGGAAAAYVWGIVMDAIGRRGGLVLGMILGVFGAGLALISVMISSLAGFLGGMVLMGTA